MARLLWSHDSSAAYCVPTYAIEGNDSDEMTDDSEANGASVIADKALTFRLPGRVAMWPHC